jgi:hypothetical protein
MNLHPPKPSLALTVGVIGHRPDRLPEAARAKVILEVENALDAIAREIGIVRQRYADFFEDKPVLSLLSQLAEGADRIVAEAGIMKGWALDVTLPFSTDIYEADFETPESRTKFRDLLGQARSTLILPGNREAAAHAYELAGVTVLGQSDILLAVWDGGPSGGRGGTTFILTLAARVGIPVICVDAKAEAPTRLLWSGLRETPTPIYAIEDCPDADLGKTISRLIEELVRPPLADPEQVHLRSYFQERARSHNLRLEFPLLMAAHFVRSVRRTDVLPAAPDILEVGCIADAEPAKGGDLTKLALAYGWADAIGVRLAQTFRSAFVLNFVFAAGAVVLAATSLLAPPRPFGSEKLWFVIPEIGLILAVIINTRIGRRRRWHERWLEARELAERLRVTLLLWLLGSRPTNFFSGEEPTWTGWYARAAARAQPPRSGSLATEGLAAARTAVLKLLRDQCGYHERNKAWMHQLDRRLEVVGRWLFGCTVAAAGLYVVFALALKKFDLPISSEQHDFVKHVVVAFTAGLPALATATYGIRVIGDFDGIAKRSERTCAALDRLIKTIEREPIDLILLRAQAQSAADAMLGDVASWRLAVESRTLAIPG